MKDPIKELQKDFFDDMEKRGARSPDPIQSIFRLRTNPLYSVSLEQIFVVLIVTLILFILVFLLGVVRGRAIRQEFRPDAGTSLPRDAGLAAANGSGLRRLYAPAAGLPAAVISSPPSASSPLPSPPGPAVENISGKPYTIQIITYRSEERARKEASSLQAIRFNARLVRRGTYFEVCVGQYENRKTAEKDLAVLRSRYKDCFLRRV